MYVFASGSCRLLTSINNGYSKIIPIHSMFYNFTGINFMGKLHNTANTSFIPNAPPPPQFSLNAQNVLLSISGNRLQSKSLSNYKSGRIYIILV